MSLAGDTVALFRSDAEGDRVVPRTGHSARLTVLTSGAMAFLAVFALALSLASGRVADRWASALAQSSTIRVAAPEDETEAQVAAVLGILAQTPGVAAARVIPDAEQRALLEPWFGPDLPVEDLPIPRLIEIEETGPGYDAHGLRQRLIAEPPGAVLDDHTRWRLPLAEAAGRMRLLGWLSIGLIAAATGAMITLAAQSSLAANGQVIRVLRLVGARDAHIARAFIRRFTLRALGGAAIGTMAGVLGIAALPGADASAALLEGLGFAGLAWLWPLTIPPLAGLVAFLATRQAAYRTLRSLQ
ncbi:MAG: cell division protein FtsX [Roseicyclus sp.]